MEFFGRAAELDALARLFHDAAAGQPRVVLVEGEAGLGKTALVRRFLDDVDASVLWASGDEDERDVAGGVLDQLARSAGAPGWGSMGEGRAPDPVNAGVMLLELVGSAEQSGTVVLVCDDVHWADVASLRGLAFALRRLVAERFLALLLFRPEGADRVPDGIRRLVERGTGERIVLSGLGAEAVADLARSMGAGELSPREAERLREHTGGNPLHITALLDELDRDTLRGPPGAPLPAPRSFHALVLARLHRLEPRVRALIMAASVLGLRCTLEEAARVGEVPDAVEALDDALRSGLVTATGEGATRVLSFTHPLVRAAIYHDQGPAHRAALHARAVGVVRDEGASLRHREAAAEGPDRDLAESFVSFAERLVERGDVGQAARAYTSAARLHPERARSERLFVEAAACHAFGTELVEGLALSERAKTFEDPAARAYMLSYPHAMSGRHEEAARLLTEAWDACDREADPMLAAYIAIRASTNIALYRPAADVEIWARRAVDNDTTGGAMTGNAMFTLMTGLARTGQLDSAHDLIERLRSAPGVSEIARDRWLLARGLVRLWSDDLDGAHSDLTVAAEATRRHGPLLSWMVSLNPLADAEFRLGRWDDAIAHAELATSAVADLDFHWLVPYLSAVGVFPLAARGDWEGAEEYLARAKAGLERTRADLNAAWTAQAGAHLAAARGDHERVLIELGGLLAMSGGHGWDDAAIQPWRKLEVEALVALGRVDEAQTSTERLEEIARAHPVPSCLVAAAHARGVLEAARGEHDRATAAFDAAVNASPANQPFMRATVALAYGAFLRRAGRRRDAQEHLTSAKELFEDLRASPYIDRTDRELAATGLAPQRRRSKEPTKLTPQESAVVHLARGGYTNKEIGSELVISVRTVEYHLKNAYLKLGISSRRELIRAGAEST